MSVLPMKRILICAMKRDRKSILEMLQRQGLLEIHHEMQDDEIFGKQDISSAKQIFQKNAVLATQALTILDEHFPEEKGFLDSMAGRKELSVAEYNKMVLQRDATMQSCSQLVALEKVYAETVSDIPKLEAQKISLEPWINFDLPLDFTGTKKTTVFTGVLPGERNLEEIYTQLAEYAPEAEKKELQIISTTPQQTNIFMVCAKKDAPALQDALHKMNFAKPPASKLNPSEVTVQLEHDLKEHERAVEELLKKIETYIPTRENIQFAVDYFTMRTDKYDVIGSLEQSKNTFILEGYIPQKYEKKLQKALTERYNAIVEVSEPSESEDVPVALTNSAFTAPVEDIVSSYALPGKGEIDPSFLVSLFYYLLFGMMLGDAGYGLIIAFACGMILYKVKTMEAPLRKTITLFFYCGISTTIWGFIFGSFFGDTINVVATTFFNRPDITLHPIWFEPLDDPMRMMGYCFGIGLIHLFTGLGTKLYTNLKNGLIADAIYDCAFWFMLIGGAVVYLLSMTMFTEMIELSWIVPAPVATVAAYIALAGAIGIILTGGRSSRNWGKRILKGLYSFYGITSYLSDVLSYSRLLALGLATSVIASVFNKMGSMGGSGIVGLIMFIIVFIIGQTLNILINLLGAYVHTNRLQYVEFFGKFYEGGGRPFTPFKENTKYYKIKEEI